MRALLFALLILALPLGAARAQTQPPATMVADALTVDAADRLIASGNVEVFFDGTRLSASQVMYDPATDTLQIVGPILIETADGQVFIADRAEIDPRLENGLLLGARLILDRQLQIAANRIDRVDGRYTQMTRASASSCAVCGTEDPLWEIRARRVIHDQDEQQLYFEDAQFRVRGVPILWLPRMRLPDPTLERATGLLIPQIRSSDLLGIGIKLPYFITLGDHRDLTLTPFLSPETRTLELRYRQAFAAGNIQVDAAISDDTLRPDETRYYLFADGTFDLGNDFRLDFTVQNVSDDGYLLDYGYSSADRLESGATISRVRQNDMFLGKGVTYQGLIPLTTSESTPQVLSDLHYERAIYPGLGGRATLSWDFETHIRTDDVGVERDVARFGIGADWTGSRTTSSGLAFRYGAGLAVDAYATWDDPSAEEFIGRATPWATTVVSFPLARTEATGATQVIEPVIAFSWSESLGGTPINEDGTRSEFDEANLIALSRFGGEDRSETGFRIAAGGSWSRLSPDGWSARLTLGKLWQDTPADDYTLSSGLDGMYSDFLIAGQLALPNGLSVDGRALFDAGFRPTKSEVRVDWQAPRFDLGAAYTWLDADTEEDRPTAVSEWEIEGAYRINTNWEVGLTSRYDVAADEPAEAGLRVNWQNECVTVELSASRRFTSSTTVQPSTDFGLTIGLAGFSAQGVGAIPARSCTN
ncbi:LPS-assembly protein LptD [Loktanella sp. IMCC34160]|uniref:LPS-assembly protein LptD n=1 Tax=Loktanella sp. IMCC34160 TaxID=2510646 RepID=UPI00101BD824|nr:LPS assembly protein LptD [Loktanella sp. IMCC34160]RYG91853.1 LPS-assembly protein LptD [Loktanella sp. IMCC34160]